MKRITAGLFCICLAIVWMPCNAETLAQYVNTCKTQVGFTALPTLKCTDGVLFAPANNPMDPESSDATNDYFGHASIKGSDNVDVTFACRWAGSDQAFSIELMVHNRQNGNTCFFQANDNASDGSSQKVVVSSTMISPTIAASAVPGDPAANYWKAPDRVNTDLKCVLCHTEGPYIASPRIAPFLAQFGLLNDGHDTQATRFHAVGANVSGSAFVTWDTDARSYNVAGGCSSACHTIGAGSPAITETAFGRVLIPSIIADINDVSDAGVMPPLDSGSGDYRWVNMDTPTNGDGGDFETLVGLEQRYPKFYCSSPTWVSARAVGSERSFSTNSTPDKLHSFSMRDGVVCLNSEQSGGKQCHDYETRYLCNGSWTPWYNTDSPSGDGDHEERSRMSGLCASPTAMEVGYNALSADFPGWSEFGAPNDRLAQFDTKGLICRNSGQSGGTCSNYAVQFNCSSFTPPPAPTSLAKNVNSGAIGTTEKTYLLSGAITGWQASNTSGRQIYVNGVPVTAGQWPLPPKTMDGKYYFTFTAGGLSSANWSYR